MEKSAPQNGLFFVHFVTFTSTHVYSFVRNQYMTNIIQSFTSISINHVQIRKLSRYRKLAWRSNKDGMYHYLHYNVSHQIFIDPKEDKYLLTLLD